MLAIALLAAYALGCLSPGWWLVRRQTGGDIRSSGSSGTGATNVARVLGPPAFAAVLVLDAAKAALAVGLARWLVPTDPWSALALPVVVAGHIWPAPLGFRGGRGAGPLLGGSIALNWLFAVAAAIPAALVALFTRRTFAITTGATLGGIAGAYWLLPVRESLISFALAVALVLFAHRGYLVKTTRTPPPE